MKKTLQRKIAEDECELNCWRTPPRIEKSFGRECSRDEIQVGILFLQAYVSKKEWLKVWQEQDLE